MKKVLHFLLLFCCPMLVMADPACPDSIQVIQLDGTKLWTCVYGDEFYNWQSATDRTMRNQRTK